MKDKKEKSRRNQTEKKDSKRSVVLPYIKNKADKMKRIFKKQHKINVCLNLIVCYDKSLCAQKTKLAKAKFAVQFIRSAVKAMKNNSVAKFILVKLKEHWRLDYRSIEDQAHLVVRCHAIFIRTAQVMQSRWTLRKYWTATLLGSKGGLKRLIVRLSITEKDHLKS